MTTRAAVILAVLSATFTHWSIAQPRDDFFDHMGGWGMGFGLIGLLFWLGIAIVIVVALRSILGGRDRSESAGKVDPLELLKERYARGEIDDADYERMRRKLQE